MLSEEYIRREKQVAEGFKEYFDKRPEFKKEMENLWYSLKNDEITPPKNLEKELLKSVKNIIKNGVIT